MKIKGIVIGVAVTIIIFSQRYVPVRRTVDKPSSPPNRSEILPPFGYANDGSVWKNVPDNVAKAVQTAAREKGYDLRQYWDPMVKNETNNWRFIFHGTMPDPGFAFTAVFNKETQTVEIIPGA